MGKRNQRLAGPLAWNGDFATGLSGNDYAIHSEQVRGERRWYWLAVRAPVSVGQRVADWVTIGDGSTDRRAMIRLAQRTEDSMFTPTPEAARAE